MSVSLNTMYLAIGVSKQSFHQSLERRLRTQAYEHQLLFLIYQIREDHPTMGCRDMYHKLRPNFIGRDGFERFCWCHGLTSERPINYRKTTNSNGVIRFDNLVQGLVIERINQVWVSDITYFELNRQFFYLTFIMDAFTRRILGHSTSQRLFTEHTTLPALEMAFHVRKGANLAGTILHSDGGGQYYDKEFLKATEKVKLVNSMCQYPWENGHAERINGVIKNNYLKHRTIGSFEELKKEVDRSVKLYNEEKPHIGLKRLSPIQFENDYLYDGKTSDGDKSATEYVTHSRGQNSPPGCGKTSSRSNIAQEYEGKLLLKTKVKRSTLFRH